jgi:hypothetical protein
VQAEPRINLVKVFSVTKVKQREALGEQVTDWIAANPAVLIMKTVVVLTSDAKFHCLSIVLLCSDTFSTRAHIIEET